MIAIYSEVAQRSLDQQMVSGAVDIYGNTWTWTLITLTRAQGSSAAFTFFLNVNGFKFSDVKKQQWCSVVRLHAVILKRKSELSLASSPVFLAFLQMLCCARHGLTRYAFNVFDFFYKLDEFVPIIFRRMTFTANWKLNIWAVRAIRRSCLECAVCILFLRPSWPQSAPGKKLWNHRNWSKQGVMFVYAVVILFLINSQLCFQFDEGLSWRQKKLLTHQPVQSLKLLLSKRMSSMRKLTMNLLSKGSCWDAVLKSRWTINFAMTTASCMRLMV